MSTFGYEVPHPGWFIQEELDARGWGQRDLAFILGIKEQYVNRIINGRVGISSEMAKAFAKAFDVDADFFATLQKSYDLAHADEPDPAIARRAQLQAVYPVREMIKRKWITDADLELQIARFFKVEAADQIPCMAHAAKKIYASEEATPAQLAWLFRVRQIAEAMPSKPYSERALCDALKRLRMLLAEPEEARHVPRILTECGVRFIIVETLATAKIDGVCTWLNAESPVIGMSLRYDRIDNFWFVLGHECEHVLKKHGQDVAVIDAELDSDRASDSGKISQQEKITNAAAANFCIPHSEMLSFIARKDSFFSERDIIGFARRMNVHPGLVVGQIQPHTKRWIFFRRYRVKIRHFLMPEAMVDGWGQVAPVSVEGMPTMTTRNESLCPV